MYLTAQLLFLIVILFLDSVDAFRSCLPLHLSRNGFPFSSSLVANANANVKRHGPSSNTALFEQSTEEYKVNSQIARLNAVAAKLRAEAAELEVSLPRSLLP
jgi:hypothetical protein